MTKRTSALWTPWAEVLCPTCHGSKEWNGRSIHVPEEKGTDEERGYCTKCGKPVWVLGRSDVAMLTRLRHKMGEGEMEQTGGMCSALSFRGRDDRYVIATAEDVKDHITLGLYTKDGWEDSGECVDIATCPVTPSFDKVRATIQALLERGIA